LTRLLFFFSSRRCHFQQGTRGRLAVRAWPKARVHQDAQSAPQSLGPDARHQGPGRSEPLHPSIHPSSPKRAPLCFLLLCLCAGCRRCTWAHEPNRMAPGKGGHRRQYRLLCNVHTHRRHFEAAIVVSGARQGAHVPILLFQHPCRLFCCRVVPGSRPPPACQGQPPFFLAPVSLAGRQHLALGTLGEGGPREEPARQAPGSSTLRCAAPPGAVCRVSPPRATDPRRSQVHVGAMRGSSSHAQRWRTSILVRAGT